MKHVYDYSEIVQSEDFEPMDFQNRDLLRGVQREKKTKQASADREKIRKICLDSAFVEVCELVDWISENDKELLPALFEEFYSWKSYIDSRQKLNRFNGKLQLRIDDLEKRIEWYSKEFRNLKEDYDLLKEEDLKLRHFIVQLGSPDLIKIMHEGIDKYELIPSNEDD